jgi:hypothetical protein
MGHYIPEGGFKSFVSAYDFTQGRTVTAPVFQAVKLNSSGQIVPATAATDKSIGILYDLPQVGQNGNVRLRASGTSNIQCGGTVNAGDKVTIDSTGRAITTTTAGDELQGLAIESGVINQVIEIIPINGKF